MRKAKLNMPCLKHQTSAKVAFILLFYEHEPQFGKERAEVTFDQLQKRLMRI